jgi:hypothetical protein
MPTITPELGSISHGTHRAEDLIPAFLSALEDVAPGWANRHQRHAAEVLDALASDDDETRENADENARELIDALFDHLDACSPIGAYFGAHVGDGADFGWWPTDDDETDETDETDDYLSSLALMADDDDD